MNPNHEAANLDDPVALLFGGMSKLGPACDDCTRKMLDRLGRRSFRTVVDAGCGTGRQTLILAQQLNSPVHAVDRNPLFVEQLRQRAEAAGLAHLIDVRCGEMAWIGTDFLQIDLLWCEGAAYNIGFGNAMRLWRAAMAPGGMAVVSELCWLADPPPRVAEFFARGYPEMKTVAENTELIQAADWELLDHLVLPDTAWVDGYYDILQGRARQLLGHHEDSVRQFAQETLEEIAVFQIAKRSYGYVLFAGRCRG